MATSTVDLLILWHMHQPSYVHPRTGRPVLPWVRLHGCSGYLDMARVLERHPGVRVTVNFVPSLLDQLDGAAQAARAPTSWRGSPSSPPTRSARTSAAW